MDAPSSNGGYYCLGGKGLCINFASMVVPAITTTGTVAGGTPADRSRADTVSVFARARLPKPDAMAATPVTIAWIMFFAVILSPF